jgi:hypothetical protein
VDAANFENLLEQRDPQHAIVLAWRKRRETVAKSGAAYPKANISCHQLLQLSPSYIDIYETSLV